MIIGNAGAAFADTDPGYAKALSVIGNISASGYIKSGASEINSAGIVSAGNIYTNNGVVAAPAGVNTMQICPNNNCNALSVSSTSSIFLWNRSKHVSSYLRS